MRDLHGISNLEIVAGFLEKDQEAKKRDHVPREKLIVADVTSTLQLCAV